MELNCEVWIHYFPISSMKDSFNSLLRHPSVATLHNLHDCLSQSWPLDHHHKPPFHLFSLHINLTQWDGESQQRGHVGIDFVLGVISKLRKDKAR